MAEITALDRLPEEVFAAALEGEITTIKSWLLQGGEPDQGVAREFDDDGIVYEQGVTLLMAAASMGRLDIMRLLVVDHGADVNVTAGWTALMYAISSSSADCVQFLLACGANTSGIIEGIIEGHYDITSALCTTPRVLRIILAAGVDLTTANISRVAQETNFPGTVTVSLEEEARNCVRLTEENRADYEAYGRPDVWTDLVNRYTEAADILEGTRLAGHSYKRWVLKDYMTLLRVRSLLARGRATMAPSTPEVIVRLFGGRTAAARRPPTRRSRPPPERAAGVPDPVFWKVMEYYRLGDWRRP